MKYLVILMLLVVGCCSENPKSKALDNESIKEEKKITCRVLREKYAPLEGIECSKLSRDIVVVKLYLTEKTIYAHPTRIRWKSENITHITEKELLKPYKE